MKEKSIVRLNYKVIQLQKTVLYNCVEILIKFYKTKPKESFKYKTEYKKTQKNYLLNII